MIRRLATISICMVLCGCATGPDEPDPVAQPHALAYTHPVPNNEVQDAAFWIHPTDPNRSLILVTNEHKGLEVHNTGGYLMKLLAEAESPQYVDVIYGIGGHDFALVSCVQGVKAFMIDPARSKLIDATPGGPIRTFQDIRPLGLFCYRDPATSKGYFFVTNEDGQVQQHEIIAGSDGTVTAALRRSFTLPGKSKGGCADNDNGVVYLSEDKNGIWQYPAAPNSTSDGKLVIKLNEHGLLPHARGPAIFRIGAHGGYVLVASQGTKAAHTCVKVYDRAAPHRYLATIDPSPDGLGALDHSSGLDVTSAPFGRLFPHGVLAVNDQDTPSGNEDFKLYPWDEIAHSAGLLTGDEPADGVEAHEGTHAASPGG